MNESIHNRPAALQVDVTETDRLNTKANQQTSREPLILLVDDSDIDTLISQRIILKAGLSTRFIIKRNGENGYKYLEDCVNGLAPWPQIIFLDISMPVSDGFWFMDAVSTRNITLPEDLQIFVLSSADNSPDKDRMLCYELVTGFIAKPLKTDIVSSMKERFSVKPAVIPTLINPGIVNAGLISPGISARL
ncbi:MAG: response regulator [Bacteroidota bacterium]